MKKAIRIAIVTSMLAMSSTTAYAGGIAVDKTAAAQQTSPAVLLNGGTAKFDQDPFISNGVTLVPGRQLLEHLGFTVAWDEQLQLLSGYKSGLELHFKVGQSIATVNHMAKTMPLPVRMVQNEVFIPLRFVAEIDERIVSWDSRNRTVLIELKEQIASIRIVLRVNREELNEANQAQLRKLSEQLGQDYKVQLEWTQVPAEYYQEKMNLMIASGEPIDLAYIYNPTVYQSDLMASIASELEGEMPQYSMLSSLPPQSIQQVKALYNSLLGIPKLASSVDGQFPVLNQNWMNRLGFDEPKTMDELYSVMDHFAHYDPDGNGKEDTYGLTGYIGATDLGSLAWVEHVFNENVSRYEQQNGKIVDLAVQKGTRDALLWLQKAYAEGVIDPEFAINTSEIAQQAFTEERSGITAMTLAAAAQAEQHNMQEGEITPLTALKSSANAVEITGTHPAYDGMYFINKYASKEKMQASLNILNELHVIANDAEANAEARALATDIVGSVQVELGDDVTAQTKERFKQVEAARGEIKSKELLDVSLQAKLRYDLLAAKTELDQEMVETKVKVITGALSIKDWDAYVAKLVKDERYIAIMSAFGGK